MLNKNLLILSLALLIFIPTIVSGQMQPKIYIGPHLGIQKADEADDANYLFGATFRMKFMPFLGGEAAISYRQEEYADENITVRNWPVTVTGLVYPIPVLYGGLGAGWYNTTFDYDESLNNLGIDDETEQKFGWHLGAGFEFPASPKLRLSLDIRYVFLDYEFEDLPEVADEDVNANFYSINIAALFNL